MLNYDIMKTIPSNSKPKPVNGNPKEIPLMEPQKAFSDASSSGQSQSDENSRKITAVAPSNAPETAGVTTEAPPKGTKVEETAFESTQGSTVQSETTVQTMTT